jgi:hypothetical protein
VVLDGIKTKKELFLKLMVAEQRILGPNPSMGILSIAE